MAEKTRCRTFDLLLYEEDETHRACLEKLASGYKYIAILHDRDRWSEEETLPDGVQVGDLKKPHWHVIVRFPQSRWNTALAKEFGIAENYIQKCNSYEGSLLYLVHHGLPNKFQYSIEDCKGTLIKDLEKALDTECDIDEKISDVLDILDDNEFWTMRSFLEEAVRRKRGGMALRMAGLLGTIINEHNRHNELAKSRPNAGSYMDACDTAHFHGFIEGYHYKNE